MAFNQPIVFLTSYLGGTHGTAKSARDFLRALLANHADVKVVSPVREDFPEQLCGYRLSSPIWLTPPDSYISLSSRLWNLRPNNIKAWIKKQIVRYQFSNHVRNSLVIVNGWASYEYWLSMETYFEGNKVLIVRESPRHFAGPDREKLLSKMIDAFSRFDHLLFVSDRVRQEWLKNVKLNKMKYCLLPNCCEEESATECLSFDRNRMRSEYGLTPNDFVVLCPGTVEYRKGQDLLLKIFPELREAIPFLRIIFVGDAATEWGNNLIQSIANNNLENTVTHWNAKPDIFGLLRVADVLAFPSRAEALPRTILEAMAMKIPIVASSVDGIPELIENGRTGFLFECDDSKGLFNGITLLYSSPELRNQYAEAGFFSYWNNYSRWHQFSRMKTILDELLSCHA